MYVYMYMCGSDDRHSLGDLIANSTRVELDDSGVARVKGSPKGTTSLV